MLEVTVSSFRLLQLLPDNRRKEAVNGYTPDIASAKLALKDIGTAWINSKEPSVHPNTKVARQRHLLYLDEMTVALFYSDGKLMSVVMIEAAFPPQDHPGDIKVKRGEPA